MHLNLGLEGVLLERSRVLIRKAGVLRSSGMDGKHKQLNRVFIKSRIVTSGGFESLDAVSNISRKEY
jgi:hypothetical protein